jgi:hypothetical protein
MLFTNNCTINYLHPYNQQVIINPSIYNHQKNQHHNDQQRLLLKEMITFRINISHKDKNLVTP